MKSVNIERTELLFHFLSYFLNGRFADSTSVFYHQSHSGVFLFPREKYIKALVDKREIFIENNEPSQYAVLCREHGKTAQPQQGEEGQ